MDVPTSTQETLSRTGGSGSPHRQGTLGSDELHKINAYWRAANYLSVGQIYLYDNPLLREPLRWTTSNRWWSDTGARRRGRISSMCI